MAFNISFFKLPKHKVFNYQPLYYDERKEHRENVKAEVLREKAAREGTEYRDEHYYPGKYISGKMQEELHGNRRNALAQNTVKIIGVISIVIFFLFLFYFADGFLMFLESIR